MARHVLRATVYSCNGERLRSIPRREAEAMIESGPAKRLSRLKADHLIIQMMERKPTARDLLANSTITLGEMEANVGARGPRYRDHWSPWMKKIISANFVDRAMSKIEVWPYIGDDLAVRVGPRVAALAS